MALYDMYEEFRDPHFSVEEQRELDEVSELDEQVRADPNLIHERGGIRDKRDSIFKPYPLIGTKIDIAKRRAEAQFKGHPAMPEDVDISVRFPGVDPVGKYSVIDMKFAQREAAVLATLESRSPEVQAYARSLMDKRTSRKPEDAQFSQRQFMMKETAKTHRSLTRASKLCPDPDGRRLLHQQARGMEAGLAVEQYDKMMQGIEYAAGVRQGPVPKEITDFYKETLGTELDMGMVAAAQDMDHIPAQLHVEFQDLDHKLVQRSFANPRNWGKSPQEIAEAADGVDIDTISGVIPPYAVATADRVIDPLFRGMEKDAPARFQDKAMKKVGADLDIEFSRGDLISIDGKTVRETMQEQFTASGRTGSFDDFYKQNVRQMTNELVAAGLMAGKRVEAFVPNKYGQIPKEPTQITKTGYEPSPLKPERFNAWQRHFAKRGYFKEKVARQAEYERVMAARERMRAKAMTSEQAMRHGRTEAIQNVLETESTLASIRHKEMFFGEIMGELGFRTFTATPEGETKAAYNWGAMNSHMKELGAGKTYSQFDRVEPIDACVMGLMAQGHKFEDIMNPEKLRDERRDMARQVYEHGKTNDQEWLGRLYFHGFQASLRQLGEMTQGVDLLNENQLMRVLPKVEALAHSAFNASQTVSEPKCRLGYQKAAMEAAGGDMERGAQLADQAFDKVQDIAQTAITLFDGYKGQHQLIHADPGVKPSAALQSCAKAAAVMKLMKPGGSIFEAPSWMQIYGVVAPTAAASPEIREAGQALDRGTPEQRAVVARQAASGRLVGKLLQPKVKLTQTMQKDSLSYLAKAEDGTLSVQSRTVEKAFQRPEIKFKLGKELRQLDQLAPQAQQQKAPHKQAPQMGGPKR